MHFCPSFAMKLLITGVALAFAVAVAVSAETQSLKCGMEGMISQDCVSCWCSHPNDDTGFCKTHLGCSDAFRDQNCSLGIRCVCTNGYWECNQKSGYGM